MLKSVASAGGAALGVGAATVATATSAEAADGTVTPVAPATTTDGPSDVKGNVSLDLSTGTGTFIRTLTGDTVFEFVNWPSGMAMEPTVIATQDSTGGHSITYTNVTWLPSGTVPLYETGAGQVNINSFFSDDAGVTVYGQGGTSAGGGFGVYGDGSDGAVVLDGTNTYSFLGYKNGYYWPTRDVFLSSLAVTSGITFQLSGGTTPAFKVFCSGLASIASGGQIVTYVNTASSGATGGSNLATGSLAPGASAPSGVTGAGAAGTTVLGQSGKAAGAGGAAASGTAGGAGGKSNLDAGYSLPRALPWAATMAAYAPNVTNGTRFFPGGASGGAGAGDGSNSGGAGGVGGNPLFLAAYSIVNNGTISAKGGRGGDAAGGNAGGGGGGQGGPVMLIYSTYSGSGSISSAGGAGGAAAGSGTAGSAGEASWIIKLVN